MRHAFLTPRLRFAAAGIGTAALAGALALGPTTGAFAAPHGHATGAHVTTVSLDGKTYHLVLGPKLGIKPIHASAATVAKSQLSVHSSASTGVVTPTPKVFVVFWGSQWSKDPASIKKFAPAFFKNLFGSADTWGTILNQYCEGVAKGTVTCGSSGIHINHPTASILGGVFMDTSAAAPSHATAGQIAAEAVKAAKHFGQTATDDLNSQYVVASAHGTHPDGFPNSGFCAYHSSTSGTGVGKVAFTNMPYIHDLGNTGCTTLPNPNAQDGWFSTETHEYAETDTDVFPAAGWLDSGGSEIGDLCVQLDGTETLGGVAYDVQGLWSNLDKKCVTKGP
ncbi:MAG TPA: hypothetical protein VGS19_34135 [Streptosporangiaceae bacterium]|nr:hypothetical protein [Streptosporangiaceae bacterium]